jgi:uncharacterized protein YlxW (UPF0749 family)
MNIQRILTDFNKNQQEETLYEFRKRINTILDRIVSLQKQKAELLKGIENADKAIAEYKKEIREATLVYPTPVSLDE